MAPSDMDEEARWMHEARTAVTTLRELEEALNLTDDEREGALHATGGGALPLRITRYYLSLVDRDDPRCPIRMQCVPRADEARELPGDMEDPLGEVEHGVAPHLVRRYPDRALLLVTDRCPVYCRFCTRSRLVGQGGGTVPQARLEPAMAWLRAHSEVRELIVSGGDPLVASTAQVDELLGRIRAVSSIELVRLATRAPVTLPVRITAALCEVLRRHQPLVVMTHFNHPRELTDEATAACGRLADAGIPVYNQTVLLRGINSCDCILEELFRGLVRHRVRPYYLLQCDPVRGAGHLRTAVETGLQIMRSLQGRVSGIALPKLVLDSPGGAGKVPIGPEWLVERDEGSVTVRTWRGERARYVETSERDPRCSTCRCGV